MTRNGQRQDDTAVSRYPTVLRNHFRQSYCLSGLNYLILLVDTQTRDNSFEVRVKLWTVLVSLQTSASAFRSVLSFLSFPLDRFFLNCQFLPL